MKQTIKVKRGYENANKSNWLVCRKKKVVMSKRKFYKKIVILEFLSEEPMPDFYNIGQMVFEAEQGENSMRTISEKDSVLNAKEAAKALIQQDSDPDFFRLTKNGQDVS